MHALLGRAACGPVWPGCLWPCLARLLVAPRVFRAPEAPAAREARQPHCVRRRASKPARALRTLRRPPHQWCPVCCWLAWRIDSLSRQTHRPWAPQPGPPDPPAPFAPVGPCVLLVGLAHRLVVPPDPPPMGTAAWPSTTLHTCLTNFACNSLTSAVRCSMKCLEFQRLQAAA